jgi:hypothetical protein
LEAQRKSLSRTRTAQIEREYGVGAGVEIAARD